MSVAVHKNKEKCPDFDFLLCLSAFFPSVISGAASQSVMLVLSGFCLSVLLSADLSPALIRDQQALKLRIVPRVYLSVGLFLEEDFVNTKSVSLNAPVSSS